MLHLPKAIQWSKDNEEKACQMYQEYMRSKGHKKLQINKAGFIVYHLYDYNDYHLLQIF